MRDRGAARTLLLGALVVFIAGGASGALAWKWIGKKEPRPQVRAARAANSIVGEFDAIHTPGFGNSLAEEEFRRVLEAALTRQNALAVELLETHPRDRRVPRLMHARWCNWINGMDRARDARAEAEALLAKETTPELRALVLRTRAQAAVVDESIASATVSEWIELAAAAEPRDDATVGYLYERFAELRTADPEEQGRLLARARERYSKQTDAQDETGLLAATLSRLGRQVELEFDDTLGSGTWRLEPGRAVLVHLWSAGHWNLPAGAPDPDVEKLREALPRLLALGASVIAVTDADHAGSRGDPVQRARELGVAWPYAVGARGTNLERYSPGGYSSFLWIDGTGRAAAWCRRLSPMLEHVGSERR